MQESKTREKILKKIRQALIHKSDEAFPNPDFEKRIYSAPDDPLDILFAKQFVAIDGRFMFCESLEEFMENLRRLAEENKWSQFLCWEEKIQGYLNKFQFSFQKDISQANHASDIVGITLCENLVARTGSIIMSSKQTSGRRLTVFPDVHIVFAFTSQVVLDVKDALLNIKSKYGEQFPSLITTITGPSRTADIEKTLVKGAHGPKEIYVFLLDDENT